MAKTNVIDAKEDRQEVVAPETQNGKTDVNNLNKNLKSARDLAIANYKKEQESGPTSAEIKIV